MHRFGKLLIAFVIAAIMLACKAIPGLTPGLANSDGTCNGRVTMDVDTEEPIYVFVLNAQTGELYYAGLKEKGQNQFIYTRALMPGNYALLGVPGDSEETARQIYEKLGAVYEHAFQVDCS